MHAWLPLTRDLGLDVSLWLRLANSALTVDTPNYLNPPSQAERRTNTGLTEVLTGRDLLHLVAYLPRLPSCLRDNLPFLILLG